MIDQSSDHSSRPQNRLRLHEVAALLEIPARDLMHRAQSLDIPIRTVLQAFEPEDLLRVLEGYRRSVVGNGANPDPALVVRLLASINGHSKTDSSERPDTTSSEAPEVTPGTQHLIEDDAANREDAGHGSVTDEESPAESTWRMPTNRHPGRRSAFGPHHTTDRTVAAVGESSHASDSSTTTGPARKPDGLAWGPARLLSRWFKVMARVPFGWGENLVESMENRSSSREAPASQVLPRVRPRIVLTAFTILFSTAALATTYAVLQPSYASESEVIVAISGLGASEIDRELQSFFVVADSQAVLGPVAAELGLSLRELRKSFSPEIVGDSTVIRFVVTHGDLDTALEINEAILESYLLVANQPADQAQVAFIEQNISDVHDELEAVSSRLETLDSAEDAIEVARAGVESERAIAQNRLSTLESRMVDLQSFGEAAPGAMALLESQIGETRAVIDGLVAELQALDSADSAAARNEAERLREERVALRSELGQLEATKTDLALSQIGGPRAGILAPTHPVDEPIGLTPVRALALGILVGGIMAFAWVTAATQLRNRS